METKDKKDTKGLKILKGEDSKEIILKSFP